MDTNNDGVIDISELTAMVQVLKAVLSVPCYGALVTFRRVRRTGVSQLQLVKGEAASGVRPTGRHRNT